MVLASVYGKGVLFSALPVGGPPGAITLCAGLLAPVFSPAVIDNLSFLGSLLIFCVGVNLAFGTKFKVANMLPRPGVRGGVHFGGSLPAPVRGRGAGRRTLRVGRSKPPWGAAPVARPAPGGPAFFGRKPEERTPGRKRFFLPGPTFF